MGTNEDIVHGTGRLRDYEHLMSFPKQHLMSFPKEHLMSFSKEHLTSFFKERRSTAGYQKRRTDGGSMDVYEGLREAAEQVKG